MKCLQIVLIPALLAVCALPFAGAADPLPAIAALPIPQCFGVEIHFVDKEVPQEIAYLKKAGVGWIRTDLFWSEVEPRKGVFDFKKYDALIGALHDAGIRMVLTLDFTNPNYDDGKPPVSVDARNAFARFAAASAKRYAGKNIVWEIWNEPNLDQFWQPVADPQQYVELADVTTAMLRLTDKDAPIVGPALNGPLIASTLGPWNSRIHAFMEQVLASEAARGWSAVTVHPYRPNKANPEQAHEQFEVTRALMKSAGLDPAQKPVISGEFGYSTATGEYDEATQAAYLVRSMIWGMVEHTPFSIWYDWHEDGPSADDKESRFGLLRHGALAGKSDGEVEKPAFLALQELSHLLNGYRFDGLALDKGALLAARFVKGGRTAFALWASDDRDHEIGFALPAGEWVAHRMLGETTNVTAKAGADTFLKAGMMPLLLYPRDSPR